MTVCIAAICDCGGSVIVMSDKMITYAAPPFHQFEHPRPKVYEISKGGSVNAVILTAGSALLPSEFIYKINEVKKRKFQKQNIQSLRDLVEIIKTALCELRKDIIEQKYLLRYDLKWDDYIEFIRYGSLSRTKREEQSLPGLGIFGIGSSISPIVKIFSEIDDFRLEFKVILAGVDSEGAQIYEIEDPGVIHNFNDMGYVAIGSGSYHAMRSFIENNYSIDTPLSKALYIVFEAKKYAESAPGVGSETDAAIITKNGITKLNDEDLKTLEEIYLHKIKKYNEIIEKLFKEYETKLEELAEKLKPNDTRAP